MNGYDFNYDPTAEKRTYYGEAEYQLKYRHSLPHLGALRAGLEEAIDYLPLDEGERESLILTSVPSEPGSCNVARKLAKALAKSLEFEYVSTDLLCDKSALKNLQVAQKIAEWNEVYGKPGSVKLKGDVQDRTVVVVDDLYQSGATMWCFAKYLKGLGAGYVLGLPCVKSLRDTDNQ